MKCKAWVVTKVRTRNGKAVGRIESVGDSYFRNGRHSHEDMRAFIEAKNPTPLPTLPRQQVMPGPPVPGATLCGGKIIVTVAAVDEPYYGGSSAALEVTYTCERCHHTYHDLPTDADGLSAFLTEAVANLPD